MCQFIDAVFYFCSICLLSQTMYATSFPSKIIWGIAETRLFSLFSKSRHVFDILVLTSLAVSESNVCSRNVKRLNKYPQKNESKCWSSRIRRKIRCWQVFVCLRFIELRCSNLRWTRRIFAFQMRDAAVEGMRLVLCAFIA